MWVTSRIFMGLYIYVYIYTVCSDCCNKVPQSDALRKQQKFSSHRSGGWMSKIRVPAWSGRALFWVSGFSLYSFCPSWPNHFPKAPSPNTISLELEFQPVNSKFSSVQSLSRVRLFATPRTAACQASLSITNSQSPPKPMSIELVMPSNHLILCHLLLLPSIFPSIRVFSNESALRIKWPKYWSFSFNISPSNEYSGLISFRMVWFDLLAVQGTPKSLFQHHSSKTSIFRHSAFFVVQLSHPYMTTEKNNSFD